MKKFIKIKDIHGMDFIINTDNILYIKHSPETPDFIQIKLLSDIYYPNHPSIKKDIYQNAEKPIVPFIEIIMPFDEFYKSLSD